MSASVPLVGGRMCNWRWARADVPWPRSGGSIRPVRTTQFLSGCGAGCKHTVLCGRRALWASAGRLLHALAAAYCSNLLAHMVATWALETGQGCCGLWVKPLVVAYSDTVWQVCIFDPTPCMLRSWVRYCQVGVADAWPLAPGRHHSPSPWPRLLVGYR